MALPGKVQPMHTPEAAENLQVIRTLMERAALYRRALAPVSLAAGALGGAAGAVGWWADLATPRAFGLHWMAVALGVMALGVVIIRRQALRDREPFWSPPARRVAVALFPALLAGLVAGWIVAVPDGRDPAHAWWLPGIWMVLFGCATHAAGFFTPRSMRGLTWAFLLLGTGLLWEVHLRFQAGTLPPLRTAHLVMAGAFGGLHLLYAAYLAATKRRPTPA
jgi:hypothetical protein